MPKETLIGYLQHGAVVSARITEIDYGAMRLRLSSKSAVLAESARWEEEYLRSNDEFYHVLSDRELAEQEAAKRVRHVLQLGACHSRPDAMPLTSSPSAIDMLGTFRQSTRGGPSNTGRSRMIGLRIFLQHRCVRH